MAKGLTSVLIENACWFVVTPLPFNLYEITMKPEAYRYVPDQRARLKDFLATVASADADYDEISAQAAALLAEMES